MKISFCLRLGIFPALLLVTSTCYAEQQSLWQELPAAERSGTSATAMDFSHRRLQLDENQLTTLIKELEQQNPEAEIPLSLPLPDGGFVQVRLVSTALLTPEAQVVLPGFRTWRIESDDHSILSGRAELTALGFHAMLRTRDRGQLFIEPEQHILTAQNRSYHSHSRRDNTALNQLHQRFSCGVTDSETDFQWLQKMNNGTGGISENRFTDTAQRAGEQLLTYDLAMAATAEYTQQFGGSKIAAQSAITKTVNRVNEIFEQELSLSFRLLDNTNIIYTNPTTDPYTNGNATLLLLENQQNLDAVIGSQNYDIGHVLGSTNGGDGLAIRSVVCDDTVKASGTTSASSQLQSDAFIVDFVAHELGHQLGATHTFNSSSIGSCSIGNRTAATAVEPGSGSTIMSYAGICGSNDFQSNVDPQLHPASIIQIRNDTHNGSALSCATITNLGNALPTADAGADYTIPARTPFTLSGSASDSNGDKLLYSWDQIDVGIASALGVDTGNNALIRSSILSDNPVRNVPDISGLLNKSQTSSYGESLPRSERKLNFRLTVRDAKGAVSYDDVRLTVTDAGERFEILSPGSNVAAGSRQINWNVADTHQAPINCSHVDISYTNDQGQTFTDLLTNTPNDGSASVTLSESAQRIRVKCRNNIFFALSGTAPHIATYNNDDSQTTGGTTDTTDDDDDGNGGGGSAPWGLLMIITLLTLFRKGITRAGEKTV